MGAVARRSLIARRAVPARPTFRTGAPDAPPPSPARSMPSRLRRGLHLLEESVDRLRERLRRGRGYGRLHVAAYRGHGTPTELHLAGRVLADPDLAPPRDDDSALENLVRMLRRFRSREVPRCPVQARPSGAGEWAEGRCDAEGYFRFHLETPVEPPASGWLEVDLRVPGRPDRGIRKARATARVRIPAPGCAFGVISDVDDTILRTGATSLLRTLRVTLLHNAHTRMPLPGAAAFFRALEAGLAGGPPNPFFYVSSTPWNLYDFLASFLQHRDFPAGPVLLRDLGLDEDRWIAGSHESHKSAWIRELLGTHERLPFVLVGDSGQRDPEIYARAARDFPGRVRAIYIRDAGDTSRDGEVRRIARELDREGVPLVLVPDAAAACRDAEERGFVRPGAAAAVERALEPEAGG